MAVGMVAREQRRQLHAAGGVRVFFVYVCMLGGPEVE